MVSISEFTPGNAKGNSSHSTEGMSSSQSLELVGKGDAKGIDAAVNCFREKSFSSLAGMKASFNMGTRKSGQSFA